MYSHNSLLQVRTCLFKLLHYPVHSLHFCIVGHFGWATIRAPIIKVTCFIKSIENTKLRIRFIALFDRNMDIFRLINFYYIRQLLISTSNRRFWFENLRRLLLMTTRTVFGSGQSTMVRASWSPLQSRLGGGRGTERAPLFAKNTSNNRH